MRRIGAFFQTLRGKLILTYTTTTVLALLALELTALLLVFAISYGTRMDTGAYLTDVITYLPGQARPYLRDPQNLQNWLHDIYEAGAASLPPQDSFDSPAAPIVKSEPMYVLSPQGLVLAAAPASARDLVGRAYSLPESLAEKTDILTYARKLSTRAGQLAIKKPDGSYLMAIPVRENPRDGDLAAVLILTVAPPPAGMSEWWPVFLGVVPATGLVLLMAVAPFGALFGLIMSRGLTRRLKALTQAVDAWSEGDFSVQPQDKSKDEISYLGNRMRRMAENVQALLRTRQELALLEERNRLARELHDTVKQETFATLMQVRAARNLLERDPAAAGAHLVEAEELIKTSQQELNLMITELRPAALEGKGLGGALHDYLTSWSQHSRIPAEFQAQNERRLPLELEQTLFRVAQEALSNVARHSRATAASVRLAFEDGRVTLTVGDNGVGFDPQAVGAGFGLQSMRERLAAIGGELEIRSQPDHGADVIAIAPSLPQEKR